MGSRWTSGRCSSVGDEACAEPLARSGTFPTGTAEASCARSDPTLRLARQLRARIVRPSEEARARPRAASIGIPDHVLLLPDGSVITSYEGEPLLRYKSLDHLLLEHDLMANDLVDA